MNIALWTVQGLLALAFFAAGAMKATQPLDKLAQHMSWIKTTPPGLVRFIGVTEILGAIGLIAPLGLGILPVLTPIAAACLVLVMLLVLILVAALTQFVFHLG